MKRMLLAPRMHLLAAVCLVILSSLSAQAHTCRFAPLELASAADGTSFDKERTEQVLTAVLEDSFATLATRDQLEAMGPSSRLVSHLAATLAERLRQLRCAREAGLAVDYDRTRADIVAAAQRARDELRVPAITPLPPVLVALEPPADLELRRARQLRGVAGGLYAIAGVLAGTSGYFFYTANQPQDDKATRLLTLGVAIVEIVAAVAAAGGATAILVAAGKHAEKSRRLRVSLLPTAGGVEGSLRLDF